MKKNDAWDKRQSDGDEIGGNVVVKTMATVDGRTRERISLVVCWRRGFPEICAHEFCNSEDGSDWEQRWAVDFVWWGRRWAFDWL